jgi:dATP/dGTP diphosphohydrolase
MNWPKGTPTLGKLMRRTPEAAQLSNSEEIARLVWLLPLRQRVGMGQVQHENRHNLRCFNAGARRTDRKPRFDLIPFEFLESVAEVLTEGAVRYGAYNWKRWQKGFFLDAWNHAFVHLQKFKEGDTSEDHMGHLACNVAFLIWAVKNGIISQEDFNGPM